MPVKRDASGNRSVQAEVEVPGTPEQVWEAIATGPGISAWFVSTEVDGRPGGAVTSSFGPGMDSLSTITAWEPPHRFAADSRDDMVPHPMGQIYLTLRFYLYGDQAPAAVARAEPEWQAWMETHFPSNAAP